MGRIRYFSSFALVAGLFALPVAADALTWVTNNPMPGIKRNHSVVSAGANIYVLGGRPDDDDGDTQATNDVYRGTMGNDGLLTWVKEPNSLPGYRCDGGAAITGGRIYYWGGWTTGFPTENDCYYAPLAAGVVGPWVTSGVTIPNADNETFADSFGRNNLVFNNRLYIINGENNLANHPEVALYSTLTGAGDYGPWVSTAEPGDVSTWWHGVAVYQGTTANYIYKIGGSPDVNNYTNAQVSVYRALIGPDGSLGSWTLLPNPLPNPAGLLDFACIQDGNKIYVIAGVDGSFAVYNMVHVGEIDPATGNITWTTDTGTLPEQRARVTGNLVTAPNGTKYLVVPGGAAGTGASPSLNTVFTAQLPPNTSVSDWELY